MSGMTGVRRIAGVLAAGVSLAAAGFAGGCGGSTMKAFDVRVTPTAGATEGRRLEVDVVALGGSNAEQLESYSMTEYFRPNNAKRASLSQRTLSWGPGETDTKVVSRTAEEWARWGKAGSLFIMANIQGPVGTPPAARDSLRRIELPRSSANWGGTTELDVTVSEAGITVYPEPSETE